MQVTEAQYEREYANRIRTCNFNRLSSEDEAETTPERQLQDHLAPLDRESSPNARLRGPSLKLSQNQVFFSPQVQRDAQGRIIEASQQVLEDSELTGRFRKNSTDKSNHDYGVANQPCSLESSEYQSAPTRSKVVKMKRAGT